MVMAEGSAPDPIPNSEVKSSSADGTASFSRGRVGRCQVFHNLGHFTRVALYLFLLIFSDRRDLDFIFSLVSRVTFLTAGGLYFCE